MPTPLAEEARREFRRTAGDKPVTASFFYHYARLVEIIASVETAATLLDDPDLLSSHVRAEAGINRTSGVGVSEAPRGTLFHDYQVDEHGLILKVNLIIATGQNNLAMNRTVLQAARHYIRNRKIPEGFLNRIEAGVRAFDPCLSCSTHAFGQMPLQVVLFGPEGETLDERTRE
jgi:NAD-reducing hydrogenase large subunit